MDVNQSSTVSAVVQGGVSTAAVLFLKTSLMDMIPYLIVAAVLIAVDLYFGIKAARKRKETIRFSKAVRRTVGQMFEYVCWVMLSASLSIAFDFKAVEWIVLGLVMGNEVMSVAGNYFFIHGYRIEGFNFLSLISKKAGIDTSDIQVIKVDEKTEQPRDAKTGRFIKKEEK